ncbi:MAG: nitroreductase family protein [Candidatus Aegiribacteria sp.]|nr:nitroreductase family protein [Candidatus Aegiribacteria sp.]
MRFSELALETRSFRRFKQNVRLSRENVFNFVDSARLAPNAANLQVLRFSVVTSENNCEKIFPALKWAGYLEDWTGPEEGEKPAAYIVIHAPNEEKPYTGMDVGIAAAYIVLSAREAGYGSCIIMSFECKTVAEAVDTPENYRPQLVIALGVSGEEVILETVLENIKYWRDELGRHHVPKRKLSDILT